MDVSIILTNYKTSHLAKAAIESIIEKSTGFSYEIIIVDNTNDSEEFARLKALENLGVKAINSNGNLGFGKANNLGVQHASGDYVFLINTDTLLINNAIYELFSFIKERKDVGAVGPNLYCKDLTPTHSFIMKEKNIANELKDNSPTAALIRKLQNKRNDFNYTNIPVEVFGYICGASLMMRRSEFLLLGGFEKEIYMYAEEALLCYRIIHELKMKLYNVPSGKIIHLEGASFKERSESNAKCFIDGTYVYYKKAFGEQVANEMIEQFEMMYKRKRNYCKIVYKSKVETYENLLKACTQKRKEVAVKTK